MIAVENEMDFSLFFIVYQYLFSNPNPIIFYRYQMHFKLC